MSRPPSIQVFVKFKDDGVVFAGEDVECTITFKNTEQVRNKTPKQERVQRDYIKEKTHTILQQLGAARARGAAADGNGVLDIVTLESPSETPNAGRFQERNLQWNKSSFSIVESDQKLLDNSTSLGGFYTTDQTPERKHSRSVSIKSLGSPIQPQRPAFRHERASSVQNASPRKQKPPIATGARTPTRITPTSTPLLSTRPSPTPSPGPILESRRTTSPNPQVASAKIARSAATLATSPAQNLSRGNSKPPLAQAVQLDHSKFDKLASSSADLSPATPSTPPSVLKGGYAETVAQTSRMLLAHSNNDTPRESLDFYAPSDHSEDTLVSELPLQPLGRSSRRPTFVRIQSQLGPGPSLESQTETLMMGYAQISGSFILDESLVNQAPFEDLKRKAVVGGQAGGGVVGVARSQSENSLFGGLNWGNIGESIGGLLGGGQPSSFKEMKGLADSKSIPLLSTPKSILFVDLKLGPGDSKSYSYTFRMPRGLPPSHRGRAIKVAYSIIVVVQHPTSARNQQQQIKQVEIPFRVFSGVNSLGESLDHDLMSPYIILRDQARVLSLDELPMAQRIANGTSSKPGSSADFQAYVNHLLTQPRKNSSLGILSPTAELESPSYSSSNPNFYIPSNAAPTTRALVDHAIRQITAPSSVVYSPSRYTIARASVTIATLMLSRPALKLGDLLTCVLDFSEAKLPCYSLEASLESSERVDPALAIRSPQSIERATRRVWGRTTESCVWAQRTTFSFQVPVSATPSFGTTGVGVEWCLRLEIVVGKEGSEARLSRTSLDLAAERFSESRERAAMGAAVFADVNKGNEATYLLDVVSSDDRGTVFTARKRVSCESFEVAIPIRIFGAAVESGEEISATEGLSI